MGGWMYHDEAKQCEEATVLWTSGFSKCAQLSSTMEMEVETSLVGDGNYSKEVLKGGSIQERREEEVQKTYVKPNK